MGHWFVFFWTAILDKICQSIILECKLTHITLRTHCRTRGLRLWRLDRMQLETFLSILRDLHLYIAIDDEPTIWLMHHPWLLFKQQPASLYKCNKLEYCIATETHECRALSLGPASLILIVPVLNKRTFTLLNPVDYSCHLGKRWKICKRIDWASDIQKPLSWVWCSWAGSVQCFAKAHSPEIYGHTSVVQNQAPSQASISSPGKGLTSCSAYHGSSLVLFLPSL